MGHGYQGYIKDRRLGDRTTEERKLNLGSTKLFTISVEGLRKEKAEGVGEPMD